MRKPSLAILFAASVVLGSIVLGSTAFSQIAPEQLTLADVQQITALIAIVDREGFVLGVWSVEGNANPGDARIGVAVREAGTASYLSSDQNAFTSRTAQFIIQ